MCFVFFSYTRTQDETRMSEIVEVSGSPISTGDRRSSWPSADATLCAFGVAHRATGATLCATGEKQKVYSTRRRHREDKKQASQKNATLVKRNHRREQCIGLEKQRKRKFQTCHWWLQTVHENETSEYRSDCSTLNVKNEGLCRVAQRATGGPDLRSGDQRSVTASPSAACQVDDILQDWEVILVSDMDKDQSEVSFLKRMCFMDFGYGALLYEQ